MQSGKTDADSPDFIRATGRFLPRARPDQHLQPRYRQYLEEEALGWLLLGPVSYTHLDMIDQLRPGMTRRQVRFIMGNPLITDTFHADGHVRVLVVPTNEERQIALDTLALLD